MLVYVYGVCDCQVLFFQPDMTTYHPKTARPPNGSCHCPIATMLQVSAVMEAFAGSVNVPVVELGLYVPQLPPLSSNTGVVLNAVG